MSKSQPFYTFNHSSISNQGFIICEIDVPTLKTRAGSDNFVLDEQAINNPESGLEVVRHYQTLPKALRTQALTTLTSNFV